MCSYVRFNTLRPRQNGRNFADDIFKRIFWNGNIRIPIRISLKFVPKGSINNIPALVQIMAWRRPGDKPLSEPMMYSLPTHICVTRPQWVKWECWKYGWAPFVYTKRGGGGACIFRRVCLLLLSFFSLMQWFHLYERYVELMIALLQEDTLSLKGTATSIPNIFIQYIPKYRTQPKYTKHNIHETVWCSWSERWGLC